MQCDTEKAKEFAGLYHAADEASLKAQRTHVLAVRSSLVLLVVGGALSAVSVSDQATKWYLSLFAAIISAASVVISIATRALRKDRIWYEGRAVAESIKTMCWRYMTAIEPYQPSIGSVDWIFCDDLQRITAEHSSIGKELSERLLRLPQITTTMRECHKAPLDVRLAKYVEDRVEEQLGWYARKATENKTNGARYFVAIIGCQIGAVFLAGTRVVDPTSEIHWASIVATLAAALIAWSQFKKYDELAQAYGQAAVELTVIRDRAAAVVTEQQMSSLVKDAEHAISREHTLWLARRDHR